MLAEVGSETHVIIERALAPDAKNNFLLPSTHSNSQIVQSTLSSVKQNERSMLEPYNHSR